MFTISIRSLLRRVGERPGDDPADDGARHRQPGVAQGRRPEHPGRPARRDGGQGTLPLGHATHRTGEFPAAEYTQYGI